MKEVKVKLLPLMPPVPAIRGAVKLVPVPVAPVRPSTDSALPVLVMFRSLLVPLESFNVPLAAIVDAVAPGAVTTLAVAPAMVAVFVPVARSMAVRTSATVPPCRKMVELPEPSVTRLTLLTPEPAGIAPRAAGLAFLNVMVWPSTFRVEPSVTRLPRLVALVARAAVMVVAPAPTADVRPSTLRLSALPVIERSAPVEPLSVVMPAATVLAVPPRVATPAATDATYWRPLARSMAVVRSPTVATDCAPAGAPR